MKSLHPLTHFRQLSHSGNGKKAAPSLSVSRGSVRVSNTSYLTFKDEECIISNLNAISLNVNFPVVHWNAASMLRFTTETSDT